jgi:hypothetical protein
MSGISSDGGLEAKAFDNVHGADERGVGGVGWEGEYGMVGMEEGCCYCNVQSAAAAAAAKWQQEERVRYPHARKCQYTLHHPFRPAGLPFFIVQKNLSGWDEKSLFIPF